MLISYILLCKCCIYIERKLFSSNYSRYAVRVIPSFLHNLMHLQNHSTSFDLLFSFRMSQGTRGQLGRDHARGNEPEEGYLPPPPTMSQVLLEVERNRR